MDASTQRPGAANRNSRLPVPRASGIPRPTFSTAVPASPTTQAPPARPVAAPPTGPAGTRELHNPKVRTSLGGTPLRQAASREQLRPASISRPRPSGGRISSTSQRRTSLFFDRIPSRASAAADRDDAWDESPNRRTSRAGLLPEDDASPVDEPGRDSPIEEAGFLQTPGTKSRKPRPSLTERTMETLANVPSSPALSRKTSAFFEQPRPGSRAGSGGSRPGSSYNSERSGRPHSRSSSRPGSRADNDAHSGAYKSALSTIDGTPERFDDGFSKPGKPRIGGARSSLASSSRPVAAARSASPDKPFGQTPIKSRPTPSKPLRSKASSNGLLRKPSLQALSREESGSDAGDQASWSGSIAPLQPAKTRSAAPGDAPGLAHRKSSAALRDQIAKARAARKVSSKMDQASNGTDDIPISIGGITDFGIDEHPDPFGQNKGDSAGAKVLQQRIATGRTSGRLNIAALGLKEIPNEVLNMYNLESVGAGGGNWAESVDLTRLVAADNDFETLDDALFPDSFDANDEETPPYIFGGLETMDLHGNKLLTVPLGFRRLGQLTSLNLVCTSTSL